MERVFLFSTASMEEWFSCMWICKATHACCRRIRETRRPSAGNPLTAGTWPSETLESTATSGRWKTSELRAKSDRGCFGWSRTVLAEPPHSKGTEKHPQAVRGAVSTRTRERGKRREKKEKLDERTAKRGRKGGKQTEQNEKKYKNTLDTKWRFARYS